jgi:tRNA G46 methylase TrmB
VTTPGTDHTGGSGGGGGECIDGLQPLPLKKKRTKKKNKKKRVSSSQKRMLNPFSFRALEPPAAAALAARFTNPALPLVVDIGAAQGKCLNELAEQTRLSCRANLLGIELRTWCVELANKTAATAGFAGRATFVDTSANASVELLLEVATQLFSFALCVRVDPN